MKKYNSERYRLKNKVRELNFKKGNVGLCFQTIKNDRIPKIIFNKIEKTIKIVK